MLHKSIAYCASQKQFVLFHLTEMKRLLTLSWHVTPPPYAPTDALEYGEKRKWKKWKGKT